ncbi:MAG: hypothetical protein ACOC2D_09020 [Spirochaetota bacterium]
MSCTTAITLSLPAGEGPFAGVDGAARMMLELLFSVPAAGRDRRDGVEAAGTQSGATVRLGPSAPVAR